MPLRSSVHKRLGAIREEVGRLRDNLRVLDEQVAYARELADEASTRALVSPAPLDARERDERTEDLRRTQRQREEVAERLRRLQQEQDELLERLLPEGSD